MCKRAEAAGSANRVTRRLRAGPEALGSPRFRTDAEHDSLGQI
jgi:hypothetical protein